jgi:transposase
MRYVLTNPIWKEIEHRVAAAKRSPAGAPPELSERMFLEAVRYRARTGTPCRDLPDEFGE